MLTVIFGAKRFRTYVYGISFTIESDQKPWNRSSRRTWQTYQPGCSTCYCASRLWLHSLLPPQQRNGPAWCPLFLQSTSWPQHPTGNCHSSCSSVCRPEGSISTSLHEWCRDVCPCWHHHHQLARWHQGGSLPLMSLLATSWNPHHWRWSCPPWRSPHCSSIRKGENTTLTTPVPSRNHHIPVAHMWMYLLAWYKQSHWRSCSPAPSSKPRMLQQPSLLHQLCPAQGRFVPQTSLPWKELTTSYVMTSTQRWSLSNTSHLAKAIPPKLSHCSRKCSQSMESQNSFTLTMVLNTLVPSLLISAPLRVSPMRPQALTIHNQMDLQRHVSNQWCMHCKVLSTVVPIHSSPSWHCELLQSIPSSHHLLSSCSNASLGPPSLPKSTSLTQQPSKFMSRLLSILTPSDHRLINTANLLHPCMLVSQLPCMTPFTRFGSPLQWYASYPRRATRYAPAMVLSTTTQGNICMNTVSKPADIVPDATLPDPTSWCHSYANQTCTTSATHTCHTCNSKATAVPTTPAVPKVAPKLHLWHPV